MSSANGLCCLFTWISICVCHLRFRRSLKIHGRGTDELSFTSQCGTLGSWYGIVLGIWIIVVQIWTALYPVNGDGKPDVKNFFEKCLTIPVLIVFFVGHLIWKRDFVLFRRARDVDIDTGRGQVDLAELKREVREAKEYLASRGLWYKIYKFWC
ncbi:unnamed protein product [Ambrosiozyma monospora]|uniref:Unnamed protein product n=1 Tax=Ambrosiozyma monospora TaxID=43982 RepID=A0ACB5TCW8_AMBMO|nr:unnamed protein product [Ambrosiozyma monospora]